MHVLEDLGKDRICYELHASKRKDLNVWCHSADLVNHIVLEPIVVFKIKAQSFFVQALSQVFFIQNCALHAFQVFDLFPIIVFLKLNVVQSLHLSLAIRVFELIRVFTEKG